MRTCLAVGSKGPNARAERKRFDEATMLSSKMNFEENSNFAEEFQRQRLLSPKSELFIIAPPLYSCTYYIKRSFLKIIAFDISNISLIFLS